MVAQMAIQDYVVIVLLIIGGLNWGVVALFGHDILFSMFKKMKMGILVRAIYGLVLLAAIYSMLFFIFGIKI
jgi:uncharacterized membrane protein YuzA (DUF378 family)